MGKLIDVDELKAAFKEKCVMECGCCPEATVDSHRCAIGCGLVDNAPIIDAAPVINGRWIIRKHGWAECSVCHFDFRGVYDMENSDAYCRHCGAKMGGLIHETD